MRKPVDRRQFVKTISAAGALGAMAPGAAAAVQARQPGGAPEFQRPASLRTGAQLDSRFPVSFATPVTEGFRLITDYFTALSQRNLDALARTLHFPFAIYEDIEPIVVPTAADLLKNPPPSLNATGKGKSKILHGSYDLLESANVHLYCPVGGAFSLSFTRYTPNGQRLLLCDGIYSVTNNDGRWGIQLASTIVHEVDFIGVAYPDAEQADIRGNQNYLAAFGYGNEAALNDPKTSRGSYEVPLPVGTRTASVNFGYGPRERSRDARENRPMDGWRTKGVKSRLNVSTETEDSRNRVIATNLKGSSSSPAAPSASTRTRATVPCARSPFTPPTTRRTRWGVFPLYRRRSADLGNEERRDSDLQERPVGERRRTRAGHTSRQIEVCGVRFKTSLPVT